MAEGKYGRLFTETDVMLIASQAAVRMVERLNRIGLAAYGTRPSREELKATVTEAIAHEDADAALTFPVDEPLFLLRGQDALALGAIGDYARRCRDGVEVGGPGFARRRPGLAHLKALNAAWEAMERWQREHPERVKVPD